MTTTRDRLIDAAAGLLDEGGPAAVTLREVGRRAGVSHNAPYKHFQDKRDLLAALAAGELRVLAGRLADATAGETGAARIGASLRAYVGWAIAAPERFRLVFGAWTGPHAELESAAQEAVATITEAVASAQAEDDALPRDTERLVALLRSTAHGLVDLELSGHLRKRPGAPGPDDLIDELITLVRGGGPA
ncbi:TetR/AcrR family transcriptional regulator [Microlunatus parietis]|uniref:AcrR family transcriptional regulator n=1 Tax=Microlunatus parietis TaxID=682979 RepID=A0A7Y9I340_9ACTN|nr:TetR/AcrR family transcriptional regulator [Microlunatus parietis]NYE69049.1 AcrR family transcriptional regulator [Microlunatus parietis]